MLEAWREFRTRQRARLSEHDEHREHDGEHDDASPAQKAAVGTDEQPEDLAEGAAEQAAAPGRYGTRGRPLNRRSPFLVGFIGALGVVIAVGLWHTLGTLSTTLTILIVSTFLTLALNPIVLWLVRHGMSRGLAVVAVCLGLVGVVVVLALVVIPPVVSQAVGLLQAAPGYLDQLLKSDWVTKLNDEYGVVDKLSEEIKDKATDASVVSGIFGGILGVGQALVSGIFQGFTILVITLYLLSSLPTVKESAYALVPQSRRPRFISLSEEILRRVGAYALGQVAVATINAVLSFVMMTVIGIPYAAILAVVVGLLGLIPMVGATIGAVIVCIVAAFTGIKLAIIAAVYYIVYQQFENYVVAPRVMQRTVSVPGIVTVIAALVGGTLMGVLGALIAIPVAAGIILIYQEVVVPRQNEI